MQVQDLALQLRRSVCLIGGLGLGQARPGVFDLLRKPGPLQRQQALLDGLPGQRLVLGQWVGPRHQRLGHRLERGLQGTDEGGAIEVIGADLAERRAQGLPQFARRCRHERVVLKAGRRGVEAAGEQQHQPQQRGLGRLDGAFDGAGIEGIRLRHHGFEVDASTDVAALASAPWTCRGVRSAQCLEQGPLLDTRAARQQLDVAIAANGIGDGPKRRQHGGHELLATWDRALVIARRGTIDEELHDGLRLLGGGSPDLRVVADDLVGISALGQANDIDIGQAPAIRRAFDLTHEGSELGGAECGGALPGGVDVVCQRDAWRVAGDELHLAGGQGGTHAADHVLEALLVGHQGVGVALDQDGHAGLADG